MVRWYIKAVWRPLPDMGFTKKKKEKKKEKDKFEQIHLQLGKLNFKKKLEK